MQMLSERRPQAILQHQPSSLTRKHARALPTTSLEIITATNMSAGGRTGEPRSSYLWSFLSVFALLVFTIGYQSGVTYSPAPRLQFNTSIMAKLASLHILSPRWEKHALPSRSSVDLWLPKHSYLSSETHNNPLTL